MTPTTHPLSWFIERIGKNIIAECEGHVDGKLMIKDAAHADRLCNHWQHNGVTFRDPHPLTSSILICNVISCDTCGKVGTTEDLDKEVAAKGFEGKGWKRLEDGTINCGCKK